MAEFPKIKRLGERAFLLEFQPEITSETLRNLLNLKFYLQEKLFKQKVEITNTYHSLLITYREAIENAYDEVFELITTFARMNILQKSESSQFRIPVCYEEFFAPDMKEICSAKNLSVEEIIQLHSAPEYLVYFTGFLPGFLYLGGLPQELHFSRKKTPRLQVQKGAVGIGETQTGIYPQNSPGGWNIIGNSPVPLFDAGAHPPCEIKAGDRLKFFAISIDEHEEISRRVELGEYVLDKEVMSG